MEGCERQVTFLLARKRKGRLAEKPEAAVGPPEAVCVCVLPLGGALDRFVVILVRRQREVNDLGSRPL